jgi:hypothetical protein
MAREADGPGSKASRSATVARRAQQIYAGKVDPKAKTKSRLTKTGDPEALRKRIAKIKDNTARAAAKAAAKAAEASAKPAKKESKRNISDAKAGRIIARLDANRPGLRRATGSDRRNRNLLQTYDRASKFVLAASTRESKRSGGQSRMDLAESVRRAVRNAKAKAKPKPAKPVNNKPKRSLAVRVAKADKADRKLKAQLKQAMASGNEKKIIELNFRRQRIDRFNKTYNFADLKASRKALTPANPTAPMRTRSSRLAGTVAKPRGMKPGVLAARGGAQPQKKRKVDYAGAVRLLSRQKAAINRLKNPQQTFNGNAAYARQVDVRTAKSTPMANAQREIRALYGEYRRAQGSAKSQYASQEVRTRAASKLSALRKQIRKAAQAARAFKPEYSAETRRRFQTAQARRRP